MMLEMRGEMTRRQFLRRAVGIGSRQDVEFLVPVMNLGRFRGETGENVARGEKFGGLGGGGGVK